MQDTCGLRAAIRHLGTRAAARGPGAVGDAELLTRFIEERDDAAFAALLERHGPMVLGVCRRVLGQTQDAEDACQATFLVLLRRAGAVRRRASVASWLYGVASRTARKLRAARVRRDGLVPNRAEAVGNAAEEALSWRELRGVLDEELGRLPEKYRAPLLLCYLEGLTRDEAAQRLGVGVNRLRARLDYGRQLLRGRLSRRGVGLPTALLAGLLLREAQAAVPAHVLASTTQAAALTAAGQALPAGLVPARVLALTGAVVRAMFLTRIRSPVLGLVLLVGIGVGTSALWQSLPAAESAAAPAAAAPAAPAQAKGVPPAAPAKKPHPFDKPLADLSGPYALKEGEVLRYFGPPFPKERQELMRVMAPGAIGDGDLDLLWRKDHLVFGSATLGQGPGQALRMVLTGVARIYPQEIEGDTKLLDTPIKGDFVYREGTPPEKIIARLQEILNRELDLPIKLTLREEERKVQELSGKYAFTPAAGGQSEKRIEIYADFLSNPDRGGGGSGTFPEFVQWLGRFVGRRVVLGKVEGAPARLSWHDNHPDGPFTQQQWEAAHAAEPVLKRIAEQTGLTVREETRRVRVLTVESRE